MSMDDNEKIEVGSDEGSFAEEDWNEPEKDEVPKWTEPDQPITTETRRGGRKKASMRYNRYGDGFLIAKIHSEELVNMGDLVAAEEWQLINNSEHSWQEDQTLPKKEVDLEQSKIERKEDTNLRQLEWMQSIQQVDISAGKHVKGGNSLFGWTATPDQ